MLLGLVSFNIYFTTIVGRANAILMKWFRAPPHIASVETGLHAASPPIVDVWPEAAQIDFNTLRLRCYFGQAGVAAGDFDEHFRDREMFLPDFFQYLIEETGEFSGPDRRRPYAISSISHNGQPPAAILHGVSVEDIATRTSHVADHSEGLCQGVRTQNQLELALMKQPDALLRRACKAALATTLLHESLQMVGAFSQQQNAYPLVVHDLPRKLQEFSCEAGELNFHVRCQSKSE